MADTNTTQLCIQIVQAHFGRLTARVVSALLTQGRLSLQQLVRYTTLRPRTVRASILVLIQHNLAWHSVTEEDGEVLEFNVEECLMRMRYGRFVWQAECLFGSAAAEVLSIILDHGKLRPPDILSLLASGNRKDSSLYIQALYKLVSQNYLKPSTILSHMSPQDRLLQYEKETKQEIRNFPTAKELKQAKEKAQGRLRREEDEAEKIGLTKRKARDQPSARSPKKRAADEETVDENVYFRVNCAKFNIHIRNRLIEVAVRERFNDSAAIVMRAALKATEGSQRDISDTRSDPISLASIATHISEDDDLASGLIYTSSRKPSTMTIIKDYLGILAAADNPTPEGRASTFLSFFGNSGKVQIEYETICRRLRRGVFEALVRERYGDDAVRITRFLLNSGKMNGDQLAKIAMMANKDVRPLLTSMSADSLVSVQEVPKGADRNPQRTFYLWYVDLRKAYSIVLGNLYKTLFNIGTRREAEENGPVIKPVLGKTKRSDVKQDINLLSRNERELLKEWEEKKEKLTILEMRVEETVFIIRDLGVLGIED